MGISSANEALEALRNTAVWKEYDHATVDAFQFGAGWLMVDQSGKVRRIHPGEIQSWLDLTNADK